MKKSAPFVIAFLFILFAVSFVRFSSDIVNPTDYETYLSPEHIEMTRENLSSEIAFWNNKLEDSPGNYVYEKKLAGLYAAEFKLTGDPSRLHQSDMIFREVNERIPNQVGVLQALSVNAITRHDFKAAEQFAYQAMELGEQQFVSSLLQVDALLERGGLRRAKQIMEDLSSTSHFDFLARNVKLHDQSGNLDAAIENMEKALEIAKLSGKSNLINWSLSNLADMYGHDGRVQKSYDTYLEALSYNPADLHSLKGIAWVAFSKDKNTDESKRIISFLQSVHAAPDYDLLLSEIAAFEGDQIGADYHEAKFLEQANRSVYGNMYHSYIGYINKSPNQTLKIAESEIENRPHPTSYNLLAWANFQMGENDKAVKILRDHVIGQTEEPNALFYAGLILKGAGQETQAKAILSEALDASFELGPVATSKIKESLAAL